MYIQFNDPSLNRNLGKYQLPHIWDQVLKDTQIHSSSNSSASPCIPPHMDPPQLHQATNGEACTTSMLGSIFHAGGASSSFSIPTLPHHMPLAPKHPIHPKLPYTPISVVHLWYIHMLNHVV